MADSESVDSGSIHNDPNFAVICSFMNRYGQLLGLPDVSFEELERWIVDTRYVNSQLLDLLMKLLRRWRSAVHKDKWEKSLAKFCCTYSQVDAWEVEEFGFPRCKIATKLRIIKNLVEKQFDCNAKFKDKINEKIAQELRLAPIGRDSTGIAYWYMLDNDFNVRVYKEEQDDVEDETWQVVVRDRGQLVDLISHLSEKPNLEQPSSSSTSPATVKDTDEDTDITYVSEGQAQLKDNKEDLDGNNSAPATIKQDTSEYKQDSLDKKPDPSGIEHELTGIKEELIAIKQDPAVNKQDHADIKHDHAEIKQDPAGGNKHDHDQITQDPVRIKHEAEDPSGTSVKDDVSEKSNTLPSIKEEPADTESAPGIVSDTQIVKNDDLTDSSTKLIKDQDEVKHFDKDSRTVQACVELHPGEKQKADDALVAQTLKDKCSLLSDDVVVISSSEAELADGDVTSAAESKSVESEGETPLQEEETQCQGLGEKEKVKLASAVVVCEDCVTYQSKQKSPKSSESFCEHKEKADVLTEELRSSEGQSLSASDKGVTEGDLQRNDMDPGNENKPEASKCLSKDPVPEGECPSLTPHEGEGHSKVEQNEGNSKIPDTDSEYNPNSSKCTSELVDNDADVKPKKRRSPKVVRSPDIQPTDAAEDKCRKRKRGRDSSPVQPVLSPVSPPESDVSPEESELSDTSQGDLPSSQADEPPSKKKRDRSRLTMSQRNQRKRHEEEEDSEETEAPRKQGKREETVEEDPPPKCSYTDPAAKDLHDLVLKAHIAEDKQSGSDKENKRRLGKENGEESDEPTSKKGRQATNNRKGRGRGKGQSTGVVVESDEEDDVPLIQLRRSSRATKGQRVITPLFVESPSKRKGRKEKEREDRQQKMIEKQERKRQREQARQEKAAAKSKKKKRGMSDEEFVPGGRGKNHRRKNSESSDSATEEEDEEDLFEDVDREESLHWSSSASDVDEESDGSVYIPMGRNAKRAAELKEKQESVADNNSNCTKCSKGNHPEWILLCDQCDAGYHTACLRPPIMLIPHGDWFCPTCEHLQLVEKLRHELTELDSQMKKQDALVKRKERLAYVGISLTNILLDGDKDRKSIDYAESADEEESEPETNDVQRQNLRQKTQRSRRRASRYAGQLGSVWDESDSDNAQSDSSSSSAASSASSSSPPPVAPRSRRQRKDISYKFEEYDELISEALEDDKKDPAYIRPPPVRHPVLVSAAAVNRGKDMTNITGMKEVLEAEERAMRGDEDEVEGQAPVSTAVATKPPLLSPRSRKQRRRLTGLDSDQDGDESEEYKATDEESAASADEDYEEENIEEELSDDWRGTSRRSKPQHHSRKKRGPVRRSARNTRRFVIDDSDEEENDSRIHSGSDTDSSTGKPTEKSRHRKKSLFDSDDSEEKPRSRRKRRSSSRYEEDSDYCPSDSGIGKSARSRKARRGVSYRESASDSDYKPAKKSKSRIDMKAFVKSSGESETDNYFEDEAEAPVKKSKKEKKPSKANSRNCIEDDEDSGNSNVKEINDSSSEERGGCDVDKAGRLKGSKTQCNGEFGVSQLLKAPGQHKAESGGDEQGEGSLVESDAHLSGVDDLSDVDELVSLFTQSS